MSGAFRFRGIVEGFYGQPWTHAQRLWWLERLADWNLNLYVHAPKDDPFHRERWREPYPDDAQSEFSALIDRGVQRDVDVGFAFSPGLSIQYSASCDRHTLLDKIATFEQRGSRFIALALDDVPSTLVHETDRRAFPSLAAAHVDLASEIRAALDKKTTLWLIPTDYLGCGTTDYLEELGEQLAPEIEIGWTGRTVLSPTLAAEEARRRAKTLRRKLLVWDNTPVADGPMRPMLHWNPYVGRDAQLCDSVSGLVLNPMSHARASAIPIAAAAKFMSRPSAYDPERAYDEAIREVGGGVANALALFAKAHRFSPLTPNDRDHELETHFSALRLAIEDGTACDTELSQMLHALQRRREATETLERASELQPLIDEIGPWLVAHASHTRRMLAAITCIDTLLHSEIAKDRVLALVRFEAALTREPATAVASYGPRRVLYPQLTSMHDDDMALTRDPTLIRDQCLADDVVRFAEEIALARTRS